MGQIGLPLLIISVGYLMTPYWSSMIESPLLIAKMGLVIILIPLIVTISLAMKKAQKGDFENQQKTMQTLGRIALVTVIIILVLAVSVFH